MALPEPGQNRRQEAVGNPTNGSDPHPSSVDLTSEVHLLLESVLRLNRLLRMLVENLASRRRNYCSAFTGDQLHPIVSLESADEHADAGHPH